MPKIRKRRGFTLIEISVVLIVIGILALGILKGISLIRSSRITAARFVTTKSKISEIPNLIVWYETSMIDSFERSQTSDAAQITKWYDIFSASISQQRNALSKSAGNDVIYKADGINNLPSLQFSSSGALSLADFFQGTLGNATIFMVFRPTSAPSSSTMTLLDADASADYGAELGIQNSKVIFDLGNSVETSTGANPANFSINSDYILASYFNGANSKAFVNNAEEMAGNAVVDAGTHPFDGLTIGKTRGGTSPFSGLISEIIIFDRALTIDERKMVMHYLSKKYKIKVTGV